MRISIVLKPDKDYRYNYQYHYKIQALIYNLIKDSNYRTLHDKSGYKFFCYSNIFPFEPILKKNKEYFLLIASPDESFISLIKKKLDRKKELNDNITIDPMKFKILSTRIVNYETPNPFKLVTSTPVIVRLPKSKLNLKTRVVHDYYYWRKEYPLILFINQIENNIVNKYKEFMEWNKLKGKHSFQQNIINVNLFHKFRFIKQISTILQIRSTNHVIIGSLWEFIFEGWEEKQTIEFILDSGIGERNSLGFGFLNIYGLEQDHTS